MGLPDIGQTLDGKYEIVRLLGEGGMAVVFEANHQRLHQRVAIKLLAPELARDAELVTRFEREARAVARLNTKHVVRVTDVDVSSDGLPYMVMEFLDGRDLDAELQARRRLPLDESVDIIVQACSGMLEAHAIGIIHRDLKPANLFLAKEREGPESARIVKILDFGISKMIGESSRLTIAGAVIGTVLYMSPEQVRAESSVDVRADVWSLGVILFELLAGHAPFKGSSAQIAAKIVSTDAPDLRTFAEVPEGLALTVRRMLDRDRDRRFSSLREVVDALSPFAPAGSLGAGIAAKLQLGRSSARGKTALLSSKRTMPMPGTARYSGERSSSVSSSSSSNARISEPRSSMPDAGQTLPPSPAALDREAPARPLLLVAIALGLLAAAGVVLLLLSLYRRPKANAVPDGPTASDVTPAPTASPARSEEPLPPPPATGTVRPKSAPVGR